MSGYERLLQHDQLNEIDPNQNKEDARQKESVKVVTLHSPAFLAVLRGLGYPDLKKLKASVDMVWDERKVKILKDMASAKMRERQRRKKKCYERLDDDWR